MSQRNAAGQLLYSILHHIYIALAAAGVDIAEPADLAEQAQAIVNKIVDA
jgi:hypothetical protein